MTAAARAALPALAIAALAGCVTMNTARSESWIDEKKVEQVRPGATRQQVLEWFGPPVAVARRGTILHLPPPAVRRFGGQQLAADGFFELFADRDPPAASDVIYYYQCAEAKATGVLVVFAGSVDERVTEARLWILLDGERGVVRDALFRKGGEPVRRPGTAPAAAPAAPEAS